MNLESEDLDFKFWPCSINIMMGPKRKKRKRIQESGYTDSKRQCKGDRTNELIDPSVRKGFSKSSY